MFFRTLLLIIVVAGTLRAQSFENSLVLTPLYAEYLLDSEDEFAREAAELKRRIGGAPHVLLGFAAFLGVKYPDIDLSQRIDEAGMAASLSEIDMIVSRARNSGIVTHISLVSGFFHGTNDLRRSAIRQDVRNAQWFSDGFIGIPEQLQDPDVVPPSAWITPSRYAQPLRTRMEEGTRLIGQRLAARLADSGNILVTISGDGEVELSFERNLTDAGDRSAGLGNIIYADYSPFMVEEFRDSLRDTRYAGDLSPASDENGDGRTFNRDFNQSFTTWRLRHFDNSGSIPYADYVQLREKLPSSGPYFVAGGFDAPRTASDDPFWKEWSRFRSQAVANYVKDFAVWITTSPDPVTGRTIPAERYYSHQIPGDFVFGETNNLRLQTSASPLESAMIDPLGSSGVTAFNAFDGRRHAKTAIPSLFASMFMRSDHWGVFEYNPSMPNDNSIPPFEDPAYYMAELRLMYAFRPHVIVPFAWSDIPHHKRFSIKNTPFETALKRFVSEIGSIPWFSWRQVLR